MQHVSTYKSHLQAKLRTVNALQGGCAHLGSRMAYSFLLWFFSVHKVTNIYYAIICRVKYVACAKLLLGRCSNGGELENRRTTAHKQFCTRHVLNPTYNSIVDISYFMYGEKPQQKTVSHLGSHMRET